MQKHEYREITLYQTITPTERVHDVIKQRQQMLTCIAFLFEEKLQFMKKLSFKATTTFNFSLRTNYLCGKETFIDQQPKILVRYKSHIIIY